MRHNSSYNLYAEDALTASRAHKKNTGTFYTPESLASLIAHDTVFAWLSKKSGESIRHLKDLEKLETSKQEQLLEDTKEVSILDPAVGDGVFLISVGNWISKILDALSDKISSKVRKRSIVRNNLYGVDLSEFAVESCIQRLTEWGHISDSTKSHNIKNGNSLVGFVGHENLSEQKIIRVLKEIPEVSLFHWNQEFPTMFSTSTPGFDIILGNPPYGSILGPIERRYISNLYEFSVGGTRQGSWNSAAHFLVRSIDLLKEHGQLGFLVPNSFLRVKQFSKTRDFLLNQTKLWKIVDEGSPFNGVTLEMISLFCEKTGTEREYKIRIESRRQGFEQSNILSSRVLRESKVFPIYHDRIFAEILKRGQKGLLMAGRGRDIPKDHVSKNRTLKFKTPYITSGRSVQRYGLRSKHFLFADGWFQQDTALRDSFENEFLVATKNYRFPRCILKPRGMIHGGGIVKITPLYENADLKVLGLILNSKLVRQISIRYLTNYSQLTCCLNTGIMEELPLVLPKQPQVYRDLFDLLSSLHSNHEESLEKQDYLALERLADALVYSLYFGNNNLEQEVTNSIDDLCAIAQDPEVVKMIDKIMTNPMVKELERLGSFPRSQKLRI